MGKYTVELRNLVTNDFSLFNFDYPVDPSHKATLEQKIINHYYFREIGVETPARFQWYLKTKLNEIMPRYNKLWAAFNQNISILSNVKTTQVNTQDGSGSNTTVNNLTTTLTVDRDTTNNVVDDVDRDETVTTDANSTQLQRFSDTPNGRLNFEPVTIPAVTDPDTGEIITPEQVIPAKNYITSLTENTNDNDSTVTTGETQHNTHNVTGTENGTDTTHNTGSVTVTDSNESTVNGSQNGYSGITEIELLDLYRQKLIDIDMMIIADLNELFMNVY